MMKILGYKYSNPMASLYVPNALIKWHLFMSYRFLSEQVIF